MPHPHKDARGPELPGKLPQLAPGSLHGDQGRTELQKELSQSASWVARLGVKAFEGPIGGDRMRCYYAQKVTAPQYATQLLLKQKTRKFACRMLPNKEASLEA